MDATTRLARTVERWLLAALATGAGFAGPVLVLLTVGTLLRRFAR